MLTKIKTYLLKKRLDILEKNIVVHGDSTFKNSENIEWDDNIYIGPQAYIWAIGGLKIAQNVIIGPRVTIHTSNHRFKEATMLPYDGDTYLQKVSIEKNVWIGDNVMIVPGVTIGEGSVVAMGSVVTKDVEKFTIVGGNPAVVIGQRDEEAYRELDAKEMHYLKLKKEDRVQWQKIQEKK